MESSGNGASQSAPVATTRTVRTRSHAFVWPSQPSRGRVRHLRALETSQAWAGEIQRRVIV